MKILLIQPRHTLMKDMTLVIQIPLGLCYIAATLRKSGHEVKILDCFAEGYLIKEARNDEITYGLNDREIIYRIKEFNPRIIGCSALFSAQYRNAKELCNLVKKIGPDIITVVGGSHPTVRPREVLGEKSIDFIIQGEAECTFPRLVNAIENNSDYSKIDGIGYKDKDGVHINKKEQFIENLDELPFPARDLLNINDYFKAGMGHGFVLKDRRNANVITSRGCPAGCIFCAIHPMWGEKFRFRSPDNVLAELEDLKNRYGVKHIQFEDDNLTYDIDRAKRIFHMMIDRKLDLKWNTPNGVALWRMDRETLDLMKRSGCYYVKFAVESGNQRVLDEVIKKPQNLKQVVPLIDYARSIGLKVGSFFVVGLPGETKKEMQDSFDFSHKIKLDWATYTIASPHYGTKLRKICEQNNFLREHVEADLRGEKGVIDTPEFSAKWLEEKMKEESRRYIKHLFLHQPKTLIAYAPEMIKINPFLIIKYLNKIFPRRNQRAKGDRGQVSTLDK